MYDATPALQTPESVKALCEQLRNLARHDIAASSSRLADVADMLESIAAQASDDLKAQFKDANDDLLAAIHKAQREAQLQEAPLKFNIGFRMSFDLQKSTITNTLSWNVKQSLEISHQIEDPNQVTLSL
jgi:hypothetical protein